MRPGIGPFVAVGRCFDDLQHFLRRIKSKEHLPGGKQGSYTEFIQLYDKFIHLKNIKNPNIILCSMNMRG
jgi:hypothetical protein